VQKGMSALPQKADIWPAGVGGPELLTSLYVQICDITLDHEERILFTVALPPPSPCSLVCDYSALGVRHHYSQVPGGGICLLFFHAVAVTALSETSVPQKRSLRSAIRMSIKSQNDFFH